MADKLNEPTQVAAPITGSKKAATPDAQTGAQDSGGKEEVLSGADDTKEGSEINAEPKPVSSGDEASEKAEKELVSERKKIAADADADMDSGGDTGIKDTTEETAPEARASVVGATNEMPAAKGRGGRRKSAPGESKGKTLNKKASKARLAHVDAKPGDHFLVKLKGFPAWPAIICDESMLPTALINSRPASAARPDGSYAEAFNDGGKRVHDRSFPVMYLHTNEFGWVQNTALSELTVEKAKETMGEKMRKDLRAAFELAVNHHPVDHYKQILKNFQEEQIAQEEARKHASATPRRAKKGKGKAADDNDDDTMDIDDLDTAPKSAKSKKRKAEDETNTPQRPDSVKKPKIKLNTSSTLKALNGTGTSKSASGSTAKSSNAKSKKAKDSAEKKSETVKEAHMTPEDRHARKEKEVLYLRHKLQRGLLTREQKPREDEMKPMSDYITMLENFAGMEVSIIRATKINKVLKAVLKLESIPREEEFQIKKRSQCLLDKWNQLLGSDGPGPSSTPTNGMQGVNEEKQSKANGVEDEVCETDKTEAKNGMEPGAEGATEKPHVAKEDNAEAASTMESVAEPITADN